MQNGFSQVVLELFQSCGFECASLPFFGSTSKVKIDILRGVKQGCPLSPLLFLLAYDPLVEALAGNPELHPLAFADDLAVSFDLLTAIDSALVCIDSFAEVSGLGRNKAKSCVVSSLRRENDLRFSSLLLRSRWPDLKLVSSTTYLGIPFGAYNSG